jgi:hypothetical protein
MRANGCTHAAQAAFERRGVVQTTVDHLPGNMARGTVFSEKGTLFHTVFAMETICRQIAGFYERSASFTKGRLSCMMILTERHGTFSSFCGYLHSLVDKPSTGWKQDKKQLLCHVSRQTLSVSLIQVLD